MKQRSVKTPKRKPRWQQSFREIPASLLQKVKALPKDDLVVGCVKKIRASEIVSRTYGHLNIALAKSGPTFPERVVPRADVGRQSRVNVEGKSIIRRDLPKVIKTIDIETPNFGDWSNGSHTVSWDREVYQRDDVDPKELAIAIELLAQEALDESIYVFKFEIDEVLNRKAKKFQDQLLYALNLLQENVGAVDVLVSDASQAEYLKTIYVNWELLPPGSRDEALSRILSGIRSSTPDLREKLVQRYELLSRMKPEAFINGTSGFRRYFGAKFSNNLVVFENLDYGNAVYVMHQGWESLSKLSRTELLRGSHDGFHRVVHRPGWESKLRTIVKEAQAARR